MATQLGEELARLGHQVHFISYDPPFILNNSSKNVFFHKVEWSAYELFKYPDYTLPLAVKMVEVSKKFKLDILHVHYAVPHATAALLAKNIAKSERIPFPNVITTLHGTDITLLARDKNVMPAIKYSIETSCGVTAVSASLKKDTTKVLKSRKNIEIIHNFYTPKKPRVSVQSIRKSLGLKNSDFVIIHLSNLRKVKRIPDLLQIMSKLKNIKNIKMLILAGGNFSPYESLANKLGVRKNIVIKRNVLDIENYINAADMGIYTSEEESFGMGILETMSYGKPVLATDVGGVKEVMQNGKTGFLFPVGKTERFADKIKQIYGKPELLKRMGESARERVQKNFSANKVVGKYLEYYKKIIISCR